MNREELRDGIVKLVRDRRATFSKRNSSTV